MGLTSGMFRLHFQHPCTSLDPGGATVLLDDLCKLAIMCPEEEKNAGVTDAQLCCVFLRVGVRDKLQNVLNIGVFSGGGRLAGGESRPLTPSLASFDVRY